MIYRGLTVLFVASLLLVAGCSGPDDTIVFDQFRFDSPTVVQSSQDQNSRHYVIANRRSDTGDFLSITWQPIDPDADLDRWVQSNNNILQQTYPQITIDDEMTDTIECDDISIDTQLFQGSFGATEDKDPLYFGQHFFIHEGKAYALMYSSIRQSAVNTIIRYRKRTRCSL